MGLKHVFGVLLLCLAWKPNGIASQVLPARVLTTLQVTNGGVWGDWSEPQLCPEGTFGVGFSLKVEQFQWFGDDTAMNAATIVCADRNGVFDDGGFKVTAGQGPWGNWKGVKRCSGPDTQLVAFAMKVEGPVSGDDTAANWIKFQCRQGNNAPYAIEIARSWSDPPFGSYGAWSSSCPEGQAICGLRTKIEPVQHSGDDTALNDAEFYCCSLTEAYSP